MNENVKKLGSRNDSLMKQTWIAEQKTEQSVGQFSILFGRLAGYLAENSYGIRWLLCF